MVVVVAVEGGVRIAIRAQDGQGEGGKELPLDQGGEIVHALARTCQLRRHVWVW